MRIRVSFLVVAACAMAMAGPVWAKQLSAPLDLTHTTKLESVILKPGQYRLEANLSTGQVKVLQDYKVVAQVTGKWVSTPQKAQYSEFVMNNNDIQQVTFAGKKKMLEFSR